MTQYCYWDGQDPGGGNGGGGGDLGSGAQAPFKIPCDTQSIKERLKKKSAGKQLLDGFNSYFDGLGWAATMFAGNQGWLGPEVGSQAQQITRTMAGGLAVATRNPQQAASAARAALETYPWQVGSRVATGTFVSLATRIGFKNGFLLAIAAAEGSMAHAAFNAGERGLTPEDLAMAALAGEVCKR
jgi:hypothetical protein